MNNLMLITLLLKVKVSEFMSAQSCPTVCDHMDCSLPGSSVHGILQEIILHWVTIPSSGNLPDSGIVPQSPALQAASLPSELPGSPVFYTT